MKGRMVVQTAWGRWTENRKGREKLKPPEKSLGQDAKLSLVIHFCFQFGASMSGVFLTLYLWRLTGSLWVNGMYNIISYASLIVAFSFGGWLSKRKDRLYTYRTGLVLTALFYLAVMLAQEHVAEAYGLFAIFGGMASGLYWSGYLVLMYDVSDDRNRIHYLAMNTIFFTAAGLIGPALAGRIIAGSQGLSGYVTVFGLAFAMFLLAALGSIRIGFQTAKHKTFYLKYAVQMMRRDSGWTRALFAYWLMGLLNGIMLFLPNILLFQVMPHEDGIGYLGMLFAALTITTGLLISKYAKEEWGRIYLLVSAVGLVLSSSILLLSLSMFSVIGFMVVYSLFFPLQNNTLTSMYYRLTGMLPLKGQFRVESVVVREIFLNLGRIASIFTLIAISDGVNGKQLPWVLLAGAVIQLLIPLLVGKHAGARTKSMDSGNKG